ncbi:type VI secretion system tip protein VgrG [Enterobacter hormaechei]
MSVNTETASAQGQTTVLEKEGVYASLFEKINLTPASSLGDINAFLDDAALSDAPAGERLTAAMQVFMDCIRKSGQPVEKLDKTLIDHHIAELDFQISRQLDAVMHHQEFQKVESLWRGLKQLVDSTDYRQNVKTEILDVSKEDLRQDFEDAPELIQSGLYQDMSVPQIVEKILRERHGMRGQDFLFSLSKEYPRREQVMQYAEDDLHFITRLLGEVGIWFRFTTDTRLNIDVVEFYDRRQGYEKGLTLPSVPPSGQHSQGVDSVWDIESRHKVVQKAVSTRDYNYRQATQDMNTLVDATRGDVTTYGEAYHWADNYLTPGSAYDRNPAPESGAFYARIRHERYLNDQTQTVAFTSCPELSPGMLLKVTGGYEVAEVFAQGVVVTAMHSHAQRDADFCVRFDGIPDSPDFSFRPEPGSRPVMAGTLPARVTSTTENDIYGHIDKDGRYRVNMLFDRENWETGFESLWVRQSRPYAGDTYGLHLPLLAGTEVAIGFEDGNPDRPYIAGVLHDSAHGDHVTIRNYRRNVLRTPANNKIRLDDERGKEHIKVSTEYGGKSQLNLGHLVDSEKQQRGEGFELRTDSWGAIRAQKGIFISADGQAKAQGQVLEMEPALARLSAALVEMESLAACAQQAQALAADVGRQQKLLKQKIEQLHEEVILGSAPKGMALVSGEDMQLSASDNMTLTAGKQLDVGAQKDFTLAAGKQLSLYSREGAKLFSLQNDIDIQAQGGNITTWSTQDTHVSSGRKMVITAQDELTLICGGGYIKINGGNVEIGGPGKLLIKNTGNRVSGTNRSMLIRLRPKSGRFVSGWRILRNKSLHGLKVLVLKYFYLKNISPI